MIDAAAYCNDGDNDRNGDTSEIDCDYVRYVCGDDGDDGVGDDCDDGDDVDDGDCCVQVSDDGGCDYENTIDYDGNCNGGGDCGDDGWRL